MFVFLAAALLSRAHEPGLSSLHLVGRPGWGEAVIQFAPTDFLFLAPIDTNKDGALSRAEFEAGRAEIEHTALSWLQVNVSGKPAPQRSLGVQFQDKENNIVLNVLIDAAPLEIWNLEFPRLKDLPERHRQFLTAAGQSRRVVMETLIAASSPQVTVNWSATGGRLVENSLELSLDVEGSAQNSSPHASGSKIFGSFFLLGVEHILIGFDHLLFLAGLLLACRGIRGMVAVITSFTLAHSITLALATFDLVKIPGSFVEPAIAASIVYVGIENIVRRDRERSRWLLTFILGLVHGFGFAGVLRELGIGANGSSFAAPLIGFNLGVEIGQLAVAAIFLPLLFWLRRYPWFERRGVIILSALVAGAGIFWFIQRVFF
ncbi:HupE/UreJ family protein [Oleiharenicola lentus]|uniref:HupE/UreJ family protein n=1 Tax=Oleiharenicola lentus TaxID=2508720 RepID=UPI003F661AC5